MSEMCQAGPRRQEGTSARTNLLLPSFLSLLDWCQDTIGLRARHPDYPTQANTRIGHVNQALPWKWPVGQGCQPFEFSDYARHDVRRRRRHLVPSALDFVADERSSDARGRNLQLRRVVLLRLKQNQEGQLPDGIFAHVLRVMHERVRRIEAVASFNAHFLSVSPCFSGTT